jgi:hypothetical protein
MSNTIRNTENFPLLLKYMYKISSSYSLTPFFTTPYPAVLDIYVTTQVKPAFITEENTVQNINLN